MSFCKKRIKKSAAFATDLFGRGRRTLSPRSTLVGQDGSTVPKGTVFTAVLFSSFCKKRIKKSAAFATDLLAGAEGLFLLARRSSVRTALPCQRARYSLPSYSRPSARSKEKNRLLSQPTFWQGQKDSNPQQRFWRPTCCHYTIPLSTCSVYHESRFLSTGFLQDLARNCIKG